MNSFQLNTRYKIFNFMPIFCLGICMCDAIVLLIVLAYFCDHQITCRWLMSLVDIQRSERGHSQTRNHNISSDACTTTRRVATIKEASAKESEIDNLSYVGSYLNGVRAANVPVALTPIHMGIYPHIYIYILIHVYRRYKFRHDQSDKQKWVYGKR